jgi:hypothetical protein
MTDGDAVNNDIVNTDTDIEEPALSNPVYEGTVDSDCLSGEARLIIGKDALLADNLFSQLAVSYADVKQIAFQDYSVQIKSSNGSVTVSRMGNACEWFYRELTEAYNKKVLEALRVEGSPAFETKGNYAFDGGQGDAVFHIFEDCLCILPPNLDARRIPFLFVNGIKKDGYALTVSLTTGERFVFSMLGRDLDPFEKAIADHIRAMQDNGAAFIKTLNNALGPSKTAQAARMLPEGIAVSLQVLSGPLPALADTLIKKATNSKLEGTFSLLKTLCDSEELCVGIKPVSQSESDLLKTALIEKQGEDAGKTADLTPEQKDALCWTVWAALPSKDRHTAVVEFAFPGEAAATYVFRIANTWDAFLLLLNRALEAVQFKREAISLSEEKLRTDQYSDLRMAVVRTPALEALRKQYAGRVIHKSAESWKNGLMKYLNLPAEIPASGIETPKFCSSCGASLEGGAKFCGQCGTQI